MRWRFPDPGLIWLERLDAKRPECRAQAAEELGRLGDVRAVARLSAMVRQDVVSVRWEAADALGRIGDAAAVPALIAALQDGDWTVRQNAARALGRISDRRAVKPLMAVLTDADVDVRRAAIGALAAIDDLLAGQALLPLLRHSLFSVRLDAIHACGKLGDPRALPILQKCLQDPDPLIQAAIATALDAIYAAVEIVVFGVCAPAHLAETGAWLNPDASSLTRPLPALIRIDIFSDSYNFQLVERFFTYAVNALGQAYLKKEVIVHVYGTLAELQPNLRNVCQNLCQQVVAHVQ